MRHPFSQSFSRGFSMQHFVISSLDRTVNTTPCTVALGNFDGVHLAHKALLDTAKQSDYTPAVFTFSEEVKNFLTSTKERADKIRKYGIEILFWASFSLFKEMSCEDFVLFLKNKLSCRHVVCGFNFHFGKGAVGDAKTLSTLAKTHGLSCTVLPKITQDQEPISSSRIRALLAEGNIETANSLLGIPHSISGVVQKGFSIGRRLDVPTLNLPISKNAAPLCHGVYVSRTLIGETSYPSITNIGANPTFDRNSVTCETYLLNTSGNFYEKAVTVQLLAFLRHERRFESFDALKEAIAEDLRLARAFHQTHPQT